MGHLRIDGDELVLALSRLEKLEALHGDVRLPLDKVRHVRVVIDPWSELRGVRAPGTGIPRVIAMGSRRSSFGKDFAAVHGAGSAVVVDLCSEARYHRLVVTDENAQRVAAAIESACNILPLPG
jgi:hypothetical protein